MTSMDSSIIFQFISFALAFDTPSGILTELPLYESSEPALETSPGPNSLKTLGRVQVTVVSEWHWIAWLGIRTD
jgi:hypothetical protein